MACYCWCSMLLEEARNGGRWLQAMVSVDDALDGQVKMAPKGTGHTASEVPRPACNKYDELGWKILLPPA